MSRVPMDMFAELGRTLRHLRESAGLVTTLTPLDDPALESFRRLFGHLLDSFEILMASRLSPSHPFSKS